MVLLRIGDLRISIRPAGGLCEVKTASGSLKALGMRQATR